MCISSEFAPMKLSALTDINNIPRYSYTYNTVTKEWIVGDPW